MKVKSESEVAQSCPTLNDPMETEDGDCSHEIKRLLLLGRKVMTNLDSIWEKAMAPHSSTLAWKIPWTEEPGRLQSMGSHRVRHD